MALLVGRRGALEELRLELDGALDLSALPVDLNESRDGVGVVGSSLQHLEVGELGALGIREVHVVELAELSIDLRLALLLRQTCRARRIQACSAADQSPSAAQTSASASSAPA